MRVIGIDIRQARAGCAATACVLDRSAAPLYHTLRSCGELIALIERERPQAAAVGSPLSIVDGGRARESESILRHLEHSSCLNPRFAPLPLPMMRPLARRGADLARRLLTAAPGTALIETHAGSAREFLGLSPAGSQAGEAAIVRGAGFSLTATKKERTRAELDALLSAVTARLHLEGRTLAFGEDDGEGAIHLPRPKAVKLVALDVDGTLTEVRSPWRHVHEQLGLWRGRGELILQRWLSGEISYDTFCRLDTDLWNDAAAGPSRISAILDSIPVRPDALKLLRLLAENDIAVVMISSGFRRVAERIARNAGVADRVEIVANELRQKGNRIFPIVKVSGDAGSSRSKGAIIRRAFKRLKISPIGALAIGDGPSDKELFERCAQSLLVSSERDLGDAARIAGVTA